MSAGDPAPGDGGAPSVEKVAATALAAFVAWRMRAGALVMLAIGGALLGMAWKGASQWRGYERMVASLTGRANGVVEQSYWELHPLPDARRIGWWLETQAELHAVVGFTTADGRRVRVAYRSPQRVDLARWAPGPDAKLTPALGLPWLDAGGLPRAELRFTADDYAWLNDTTAGSWPLNYWWGPDAEKPKPGTEMEALWIHLDRPLDLLARGWAAPSRPIVEMAYDPERPEQALPLPLPARDATRTANDVLTFAFLAVIGGLFWLTGCFALWKVTPWWAVVAVLALPLLLPFWSHGFERAMGWLSPRETTAFFADLATSVDYARAHELLVPLVPSADEASLRSAIWSYRDSHFAPILAGFTLRRPEPPPADADAAWAAISTQLANQAAALDEDQQRHLLMALMEEARFDRVGLGHGFVEAARRMALDTSRSDNLHEWANAYLARTLEHTSLPIPSQEEIGYAPARATVTQLVHSSDPDVRKWAQQELDEADKLDAGH